MRSARVLTVAVALTAWLVVAGVGAPSASADTVLYDQSGTVANGPNTADGTGTEGAADFVVPPGTTWTLSSLVVTAFDQGNDVSSFNVAIYADNSGVPGTVVTGQTDAGTGGGSPGNETITLNPVIVLPSGTYWLGLQGAATSFWYWATNATTVGNPGMWRDPTLFFAHGCSSFSPTAGCFGDSAMNDYLFQLVGTSSTTSGSGLCNGLTPTIVGSGAITGTSGPDVILGSSGADDINGGGGADTICAGDGDDVVHGGGGGDRIDGGAGKDQIYGQAGDDVLAGNGDNDLVKGQDGNDQISGGQGSDKLAGGTGDDFLSGGDGNDHIFGNDGSDKANGSAGNDTMFGGAGNDDLHGNAGEDSLDGGIGTDSCKGGGGTDTLAACENA